MEQHSDYVSQLKLEFDSCDSTSSGFLDRDDLTELCRKLRLDTHLPLLLHTLLGERHHARVNFEEFKEGFVAVLSRSLDFSTSEDDSSYLQPVVPEEVKPKLVKGSKRYGRRSHPDSSSSAERRGEEAQGSGAEQEEGRRAKLRRSTSLDSVESLKSDEEAGSQKENVLADFQSKGVQQEEAEPGGGGGVAQEVDELLDVRDFQKVMRGSAPFSCSTPLRSADLQRTPYRGSAALEECSVRSTSPSLLTAAGGGQRVLTRLDEGSGCTGPERVLNLWREEGIRNSRDILQTLDFSLEERLSLVDLTLALDNELLVSGNGIHQAALISYKNEIQHLQVQVEQACRQRDKMKADLEQAEQRNLQLVGEVDERHACMETLNHSRIRELQQDFRERVQCVRSEAEQENEALLEKGERERASLQEELRLLREKELQLEEELSSTSQESRRLEEDLRAVKMKLSEAESSVNKLQRDLDQLLHLKFGSLDPAAAGLSHEERFSQIVKDYELQLRELRDRNDELSSEVELLKNQRSEKKSRRSAGDAPNWTQQHNSDESDMKRGASPPARKKLQPSDKTALCSLEEVSGPALSIQTELAVEQLKIKHNEDLQQLHIQLETQVNYYERSLEVMRQSMEVERKDISQAFKMEISEVEEQKSQVEQQVKELKEALEKRGRGGGGGWSHEQERKMQRERADLEQNFAREIGNLVKSLRDEKDELEAELQLKMDRETMLLREEEAQRNEEQRAFWENRLDQSEQETKSLEEQLDQSEQERKSLKEQLDQSEQGKKRLEEQLAILMEAVHDSHLLLSQSEASTQEVRRRCKDLEEHLKASRRRCEELEEDQRRCEELEEHLKASRRRCKELEEDQRRCEELEEHLKASRRRCEELEEDLKASRRRCEELEEDQRRCEEFEEDLKASRRRCEELEERLKEACRQLEESIVFLESQELLNKRLEEEVRETRRREEQILHECASSSLTEEKDSLRRDRARLIQDLKEQAMAVDHLQEALDGRRSDEEALQEEVLRLNQENRSYSRLADQLSEQIVEMEEEMEREEEEREEKMRRKEEMKMFEEEKKNIFEEEKKMFEEEMRRRQQEFEEAKKIFEEEMRRRQQEFEEEMRRRQQEFEEVKKETQQHLEEMEALVLALEEVMDSSSPHSSQLEEARSENVSLQERLSVRQQEVQSLEEEVSKRRRKLEEMESDHERSREEEERLHKENSGYREEVLLLSSRNLQLSNENAELSSLLHGDQESVRMLRERLATVAKEQEDGGATVRRLQDAAQQQQRETMQLQAERKQDRKLKETELNNCKEKLERLSGLQSELSSLTLKLQWMEEDKHKLLKEAEERNKKVEGLEAELLRDQLLSVSQERHEHAQEVTSLNRKLQDAQSTLEDLLKEREGPSSLQEENLKLRVQNQELQHKLSELQVRGLELHKLTLEQQNLKSRVRELQEEQKQNQDQAVREALRLHSQQSSSQISMKQDQYEKAVLSLQQRTDQLETKLKAVRLVLQEKVSELREQLSKSSQLSAALQDLYVENAQLMKALQVTEQRQKHAEKKNFQLEDKVSALTKLLRDIVPAALAT